MNADAAADRQILNVAGMVDERIVVIERHRTDPGGTDGDVRAYNSRDVAGTVLRVRRFKRGGYSSGVADRMIGGERGMGHRRKQSAVTHATDKRTAPQDRPHRPNFAWFSRCRAPRAGATCHAPICPASP